MIGGKRWRVQDRWKYNRQFTRLNIPLVRRIYPQIVANNIVSTQPLSEPASLIHYLRFRYSGNTQYAAS